MKRALAGSVAATAIVAICLSCSGPPSSSFCTTAEPETCRSGNVKHGCDGDQACGEGRSCVENTRSNGTTYAACAIGGKEAFDERCERDDDATICDGETWVRCHGRYHEQEADCRSLGRVCEQLVRPRVGAFGNEAIAKCVESHGRDEACAAATTDRTFATLCDGETEVFCFGGFVLDRVKRPCRGTP